MSRAFIRESDDAPERPIVTPRFPTVPPGVPNYMTPAGAQRLRDELAQRPASADRAHHLRQTLQTAVIVSPSTGPDDQVHFGATVTVRDAQGETKFRIVGLDEVDVDRGWISWLSPLAKALMNERCGQRVLFQSPAGTTALDIVSIAYE